MILVKVPRLSFKIPLQSREKLIVWEGYFFVVSTSLSGCFLQRKHLCAVKRKKFPLLSWRQRSWAKDNSVLSVSFRQKHRGPNMRDKVLELEWLFFWMSPCWVPVCLLHVIYEHTASMHTQAHTVHCTGVKTWHTGHGQYTAVNNLLHYMYLQVR